MVVIDSASTDEVLRGRGGAPAFVDATICADVVISVSAKTGEEVNAAPADADTVALALAVAIAGDPVFGT